MVELKDIRKSYYLNKTNEVKVLKGIDLQFRKSEFVSILGPSGCGKTTLLNIIGGLDSKADGEVIVDGVSSKDFTDSDWDNYRNKRIGFVFQSYNLIPHINVLANVEIPLVLAGVKKSESHKRAAEALKRVGLEAQINKKPMQLSGGQMQRVAIARALVTDPDIILADEPTGALDKESSVQVMDLLKEVASDRLVVMVTHNDDLAEKYSTRIINLGDGVVAGDSNPLSEEEIALLKAEEPAENEEEPEKEHKKRARFLALQRKKTRKSHLSVGTAFSLSLRNLGSKKVRTALTSFAGSIGIIGIVLVLAFSTGVNAYITNLEASALSVYPLAVEKTALPIDTVINSFMGMSPVSSDKEEYPDGDTITTNIVISNVLKDLSGYLKGGSQNDLESFKKYIEENKSDKDGYTVRYKYGVDLNVYADDPGKADRCMKVEPFQDVMDTALEGLQLTGSEMIDSIKQYAKNMSSWTELMENKELLHNQYDLVGKNSRWPRSEVYQDENGDYVAEIVITVNKKNQLNDYSLFMLGLKSQDEMLGAISGSDSFKNASWTVDDLLKKEYYILGGSDYYYQENVAETEGEEELVWRKAERKEQHKSFVEKHFTVKAKVVGVIRPSRTSTGLSVSGAVGYDSSLMKWMIKHSSESEAYKALAATVKKNAYGGFDSATNIIGGVETKSESVYNGWLKDLGVADLNKPTGIYFYASSFAAKEKIIRFIDNYNESVKSDGQSNKQIKYTDMLSSVMMFVNTMSTAITSVLIGFSAISLIVSSIMIAVIIYTSVLERRKEVGTLRSIGARKRDISVIFMAESAMLGALSGVIGVVVGWIITLPVNVALTNAVGIPNLAIVEWWHGVGMLLISIGLSVIAGVVPALLGAKQDPAIALRTE